MLETLESRTMFAANVADAPATTAFNYTKDQALSLNYTKIEYNRVTMTDVLVSSKVSSQDFHFVMKMSKASPKL